MKIDCLETTLSCGRYQCWN